MTSKTDATESKSTAGGRIGISLFLSVFLIMGLIFTGLILKSTYENAVVYTWDEVACTITHSDATIGGDDSEDPYSWDVRYTYEYNDRAYTGSHVAPDGGATDSYRKIQRLMLDNPPGSETTCYVNPDAPHESYLAGGSLMMGFFIFLPLIFVLVGGGGIWMTWFGKSPEEKAISADAKPISGRSRGSRLAGFGFGTLLLIVGLSIFAVWGGRLIYNLVASAAWPETACTIVHSRLLSHDSDDGTTYSFDILYEYEVDGQLYRSNAYRFMGGSSSGYAGKKRVLKQFPRGSDQRCYVNPDDPTYAVLDRTFSPIYLLTLLPLLLVFGGLALMRHAVVSGRSAGSGFTYATAGREPSAAERREPMVLKRRSSPLMRCLGMLFLALFWNGIVSVFVWQVVQGWRRGDSPWFLTIFMLPFVAVGLIFIAVAVQHMLAIFNPVPQLRLTPGVLRLGETGTLQWRIKGRVSRISTFTIRIEGREEATYQRGTNTYTDKETFFQHVLVESTQPAQFQRGSVEVPIPSTTMHSFAAKHNKIVWVIRVHGDILRWPDVEEEFAVEVTV